MNPVNITPEIPLVPEDQYLPPANGVQSKTQQPETNIVRSTATESRSMVKSGYDDNPLPPPSGISNDFNAPQLYLKLDGFNGGTDVFSILEAVHKLFVEMRRQSAESKQDAYRAQWIAYETKAKEMESAAQKDFAASMTNSAMSMAGGAFGMRAGFKAARQTNNAMKMEVDIPKTTTTPDASLAPKPTIVKSTQAEAPTTTPANANTPKTNLETPPKQAEAAKDVKADAPQNNKGNTAENARIQQQAQLNMAQNTSNMGMAYGQFFTGLGGVIAAPLSYVAELDRADSQRQEAEATKAQADVESEAEFVRSVSEGLKSIQDFLDQFIASRAQVNNKIMA